MVHINPPESQVNFQSLENQSFKRKKTICYRRGYCRKSCEEDFLLIPSCSRLVGCHP